MHLGKDNHQTLIEIAIVVFNFLIFKILLYVFTLNLLIKYLKTGFDLFSTLRFSISFIKNTQLDCFDKKIIIFMFILTVRLRGLVIFFRFLRFSEWEKEFHIIDFRNYPLNFN